MKRVKFHFTIIICLIWQYFRSCILFCFRVLSGATKHGRQHWVCCYAGRRINPHLFVRYQQRFGLDVHCSAFVVNFNFSFSIGLRFRAGHHKFQPCKQALPVSGNFMRPFITIISFFILPLCFSQVTTSVETVIVDSGKYEFKLQAKKDTADYSKAFRILSNQVKQNPKNAEFRYFLGYAIDRLNADDGKGMFQLWFFNLASYRAGR